MRLKAPAPLPMESPCSWITRAAAHNGIAPINFICHIGVTRHADIDLAWAGHARLGAVRTCGLPRKSFQFASRLLRAVRRLNLEHRLLLSHHDCPRYRFCRECFKEQGRRGAVHLPLHWRFSTYRWCTLHERLLDDRCPHCGAFVILPANHLHAVQAGRRAQLDACAVCGGKLTVKPRANRFEGLQNFQSPEEVRLLRNGLAAMSALWNGYVLIEGASSDVLPLSYLRRLEREGHLPTRPMRFDRLHVRQEQYRQPWTDRVVRGARTTTTWSGLFVGDYVPREFFRAAESERPEHDEERQEGICVAR